MKRLLSVPLERRDANEFVMKLHRHHGPVHGDKYRIAAQLGGKMVGVIQCGRPVSRVLDDGKTIEVVRCCTDGTPHVCSYLYARAARVAQLLGYKKIITYILNTEQGTSLKACGWHKEADTKGGSWDTPARPRKQKAPTVPKQRWAKEL